MTDVVIPPEDDFDKAFGDAATAAEQQVQLVVKDTSAEDAAKAAKDAADAAAAVAATKTPEELAAEAAATKAADDAAAAAALAAETPEQKTARETAEAEAKVTADAKAADDAAKQALIDAAATVKAAADAKALADAKAAEDAAKAETPEQKAAREALEASIAPYEQTAEEKAAMEKFKIDFPGEYAAMMAQFKSVDKDINARVFKATQTMIQQIYKDLAPIAANSQDAALRIHLDTIHKAHADFDEVIKGVPEWIKSQPAYLQPAMQAAYDNGDAQSVIDLVAGYKAATGKVTPTVTKTATELAAEAAAATAATAKAAKAAADAAALLPVNGKRTTPTPKGNADPNDFDGAFAEAAAAA